MLYIPNANKSAVNYDLQHEFKTDVKAGLEKGNKQIPSKYLYDTRGCELFNQISRHPDYYLTRCEFEILNLYKKRLVELVNHQVFNLVELGPGEGIKTDLLIHELLKQKIVFDYLPVDISKSYLEILVDQYYRKLPELNTVAIHSDYFNGLKWLKAHSTRPNLVLFLGSSIGNFTTADVHDFLSHLHDVLKPGDFVLLGFDLCKDIQVLLRAYSDADGITKNFNLNLLQRMNRELGANFLLDKFYHHATYNVYTNAMESYLISLVPQTIYIDALSASYYFEEFEPLHLEFSHKYRLPQIEAFAEASGFKVIEHFTDKNFYFADSLWQVL